MRLAAIVLALGLPGCDRVLGLTQLHPLADAHAGDSVPEFAVTGRYHELYATNDSNGMPTTVDRIYDPTEISLTVVLDDNSTPLVAYHPDGTFMFGLAAAGQAYRLRVTNDVGVIEYQLAAPTLDLAVRLAGRPSRTPVTKPTYLDFGYGGSGTAIITTTGLYTETGDGASGTVAFDYHTAVSVGGTLGLLDATDENDRIVFTLWGNYPTTAPTYSAIGAYAIGQVTMTDGGSFPVGGTLVANAQTQCAHLLAEDNANFSRLASATGTAYSTFAGDWYLYAVPSARVTVRAGALPIAAAGYASAVDVNVEPTFGNPYPGTDLLASAGVAGGHTMAPPSQVPFVLYDNFRAWAPVDTSNPSCAQNLATLAGTLGLAAAPVVGGTALTSDGQTISIDPQRPLPMSWSLRASGPVDYYTVTLAEVKNSGVYGIQTAVTTQPSALLDPALFVTGHVYAVLVGTHVGLPNTADGDTTTASYPQQDANMWSTAFIASIEGP